MNKSDYLREGSPKPEISLTDFVTDLGLETSYNPPNTSTLQVKVLEDLKQPIIECQSPFEKVLQDIPSDQTQRFIESTETDKKSVNRDVTSSEILVNNDLIG